MLCITRPNKLRGGPVLVACLAMLCSQAVKGRAPPYLGHSESMRYRAQRRAQAVPGLWDPTWTPPADCLPLRGYTVAETTAWLASKSFNVSQTHAGKLDGATLVDLIDGTLQTDLDALQLVPLSQLSRLVTAVKNDKTEPFLALPPRLDPCSRLYDPDGGKGSEVEVSAVVEKVLEFDTEGYTFEVILNIGFIWEEDRTGLLPVSTPDEMEACPVSSRCGACNLVESFNRGETCLPRNGQTDPRDPMRGFGVNKCCSSLWNPVDDDPFAGVFFPNAKETEILNQEGPSYYEVPPLYALAYTFLRMRGVFYVPMEFKKYPFDVTFLDMHMTTKAPMSFFNMSNISVNPNATAYYVAGGPLMPTDLKEELGLLEGSACSVHASNSNAEAGKKRFEDLSGFTISKEVDVLQLKQDTQDCMWHSPCNATWPTKFSLMIPWLRALGIDPFVDSDTSQVVSDYSFIVFRMTVCRRPQYYLENVFLVVILLNVVNILSLLLPPKEVDTRLASCATMVLALMVLQQFVADSTPKAGYTTDGQRFVKLSNFLMIAAGAWSVLAYQASERSYSILRLFVRSWDPDNIVIEYEWIMWDHVIMIIICIVLIAQIDEIFSTLFAGPGAMLIPSVIVGFILIVIVLSVWAIFLGRWVAAADTVSQGQDIDETKPRAFSKVAALPPGHTEDLTVTDASAS